jgi:tripartite-type tricarboxylate transporter receptor subunit TctC
MKFPRRRFLHLAAGAAALPAVSRIATAQTYPTRPVHLIVGFAAGGPNDIFARLIGQWLSERLGQPFIIENRPGAASNAATEAVVRAAPDGLTLLHASAANAVNATLYGHLNFDFIRDIAPVAGIARTLGSMEVNPSVPVKTVPEFIAYAKANPGKINMATAGIGSAPQVWGELFKAMAGVDLVAVPYRGTAPALIDLMGGQVQVMFGPIASSMEYIRAGKTAPAGGDHGHAFGGAAGDPDRGRICAGLRGQRLAGHRRAEAYACRDHRDAQQGDQHRSYRSRDAGADG